MCNNLNIALQISLDQYYFLYFRIVENHSCDEYIAVYVDDVAISAKDPKKITDDLQSKHHFKLRRAGPPTHHLRCAYTRDPDGTIVNDPTKCIKKILETYEYTFGSKAKKARPPHEESLYPELDTSELCNVKQIRQYQTLIGQLMWAVTLGRLKITASVMTMSRFRQSPRVGHLQ